MSVYRITEDGFEPLGQTSFEAEKIYERSDIQRMLRDKPEILEEGLFIVAEEYGDWEESNRRIDLLGLDRQGRLVVVELKRSDDDSLMDLQAIRYAAMVANMTLEQIVDAHRDYLNLRNDDGDAETLVLEHVSKDDAEVRINTSNPKIILASANFSKELTTSVLWLNQIGMDVACVKLQPYRWGNDLFLERIQVIPVPEATDYLVRLRNRGREVEGQESSQVETTEGADRFESAIDTADESQKERLGRLYELAVALEREELATLSTRSGSVNTVLRVRLPGSDRGLFNVFKNKSGWGYLQFAGGLFDSRAPKSKKRLEEIMSPTTIGTGSTYWELPEGFVEAMTDAYREANGFPLPDVEEEDTSMDEPTGS